LILTGQTGFANQTARQRDCPPFRLVIRQLKFHDSSAYPEAQLIYQRAEREPWTDKLNNWNLRRESWNSSRDASPV